MLYIALTFIYYKLYKVYLLRSSLTVHGSVTDQYSSTVQWSVLCTLYRVYRVVKVIIISRYGLQRMQLYSICFLIISNLHFHLTRAFPKDLERAAPKLPALQGSIFKWDPPHHTLRITHALSRVAKAPYGDCTLQRSG